MEVDEEEESPAGEPTAAQVRAAQGTLRTTSFSERVVQQLHVGGRGRGRGGLRPCYLRIKGPISRNCQADVEKHLAWMDEGYFVLSFDSGASRNSFENMLKRSGNHPEASIKEWSRPAPVRTSSRPKDSSQKRCELVFPSTVVGKIIKEVFQEEVRLWNDDDLVLIEDMVVSRIDPLAIETLQDRFSRYLFFYAFCSVFIALFATSMCPGSRRRIFEGGLF